MKKLTGGIGMNDKPKIVYEENNEKGICSKCGNPYIPPKGLFYGDPTICNSCRRVGTHYGSSEGGES